MQPTPFNEVPAHVALASSVRRRPGDLTGTVAAAVVAAVAGALLSCVAAPAGAQPLEQSLRHPWSVYIFVATTMPHQSLVSLAREAALAHASLTFRGFPGTSFDLPGEQRLIAQLNEECCGVEPDHVRAPAHASARSAARAPVVPSWSIDPALYQRFDVTVVPTFVLAETGNTGQQAFTKVSGDMALASALKYFAQASSSAARRQAAAAIYQSSFGGRP